MGTTPLLAPNVWANEEIPKLTSAPGNRTRDLMIARPTLYLKITDATLVGRQNEFMDKLVVMACKVSLITGNRHKDTLLLEKKYIPGSVSIDQKSR